MKSKIHNTHHSKRWSLPPILANLLPCRGLHATRSLQYAPRCPLYAFLTNKPNSPIVQSDLTSFTTMNYAISTSLTKVKNKPNSNPIKPNSNPILAQKSVGQSQNKPNFGGSYIHIRLKLIIITCSQHFFHSHRAALGVIITSYAIFISLQNIQLKGIGDE
jgi:hypothetical protein